MFRHKTLETSKKIRESFSSFTDSTISEIFVGPDMLKKINFLNAKNFSLCNFKNRRRLRKMKIINDGLIFISKEALTQSFNKQNTSLTGFEKHALF
jgi:hypothetical protein